MIRSGWGKAPLRRLLLVSAAAVLPVLAGCEAGNNAPTLQFHPPTDAATADAGSIAIRNVFVLGAPLGSNLSPGQSASLFFALVNTGTKDRLLSITAPGSAASVRLPAGGVLVSTNQQVLLTGPTPTAYLVDLTRPLISGSDVTVVMHFLRAGSVTVQVPIFARAAHLVTYAPPPTPTVTPTPTPTRRHHHRAGSPTPTPTPTPSPS